VRILIRPGHDNIVTVATAPMLYTSADRVYVPLLDRLLYRHPFEGRRARRYARDARPAFGDFDERLLDGLATSLDGAQRLLDLGSGPGHLARCAVARWPALQVIAIEPSHDFAIRGAIRATGEALPLADRSIDVAICLSSIRHVGDRAAALGELRRVVRGTLVIVELDPDADRARIAHHADQLGSILLRRLFGPLMLRTAPPAATIATLATNAGFQMRALRPDPVQPFYIMELA
jgi:SAM-dependent methyltransferase